MNAGGPRPSPPADTTRVTLDCAGTAVALVGDEAWLELARREYQGFAVERPASVTIRLEGAPRITEVLGRLRERYPRIVDGLVFHGAVLVFGEAGYLCCGEPGAGKSTLAALCPGAACSDELGAVRRTSSGLVVASLPYYPGRRAQARLAGVMLLRHGARDELQPVERAEALALLSRHAFWPEDPEKVARGFHLLADLVDAVPVSWLLFRPTPEVARLFAPGGAGAG